MRTIAASLAVVAIAGLGAIARAAEVGGRAAEAGPTAQGTLLLGDSLMKVGLGPVLRRALESDGPVTLQAKSATGLARPDVYDWGAVVDQALAGHHFERAVVFLGANDCQKLTGPGEGSGAAFGTPAWEKGYRARVQSLLAKLCDGADEVIWLGPPPMRKPAFDHRLASLEAILADEVEASPCGHALPTRPLLGDKRGGYRAFATVGKRRRRIREADGIHLTQHGGRLVTDGILGYAFP